MTVLRVCYKHGVRFDESYYIKTHLPLVSGIMGPFGVKKTEFVKIAGAPDGSAPLYQAMFTAYFDSADALQRAMSNPRMPEVIGDIAKFYDGMPDMMIGETVG